jgi:uncharacterized membrane protein YeaQ/YmgE (transglycosylase-associated protein family)
MIFNCINASGRWIPAGGGEDVCAGRMNYSRVIPATLGYAAEVGLLVYLIILFFIGLFVGALARLLLPGPDPMGIGMTALVGLCGTFSAGLFSWYVLHRHGGGLILSVLFSMLVVWIFRQSRGGSYRRRGP